MHQLTHYGKLILCNQVEMCKNRLTVARFTPPLKAVTCHGPELCKYNKGEVEVYWRLINDLA